MDCIGCGNDEVFNRVIVNQVSREELALYCADCETDYFGDLLEKPSWHQENGCAFCDNPGTYKLPPVECLIRSEDGFIQHVEYMLFDDVVAICESHLRELVPQDKVLEELLPDQTRRDSQLRV